MLPLDHQRFSSFERSTKGYPKAPSDHLS
jgi:hypothetical protein